MIAWAVAAALLCVSPACTSTPAAQPAARAKIETGVGNGTLNAIGAALAGLYSRQIAGLTATSQRGKGLEANADDLERGVADLAFVDSETSYVAYRQGTMADSHPHTKLRAIGILFPTVVHVFARRGSGIKLVSDLRGKRIAVGAHGSDSEIAAALILQSDGLTYNDVHGVFTPVRDPAAAMTQGQLDAIVYYVPFRHVAAVNLTTSADVALIPLGHDAIARIQGQTQRSRFLKSVVVPQLTYRGQTDDVLTVGEDILLLCREDLPEKLVYDMTRILFESIPELARAHPAALAIDADRAAATAIPLHPGAARYYRERELPK